MHTFRELGRQTNSARNSGQRYNEIPSRTIANWQTWGGATSTKTRGCCSGSTLRICDKNKSPASYDHYHHQVFWQNQHLHLSERSLLLGKAHILRQLVRRGSLPKPDLDLRLGCSMKRRQTKLKHPKPKKKTVRPEPSDAVFITVWCAIFRGWWVMERREHDTLGASPAPMR